MNAARMIASSLLCLVACTPAPDEASAAHAEGAHGHDHGHAAAEDDGCIHENEAEKAKGEAHEGSCGHEATGAPSDGHYGSPFALAEARALGEVVGALEIGEEHSEPVLVTGTVKSVCKKKGCWMVLEDGPTQARVLMKDHAFAVPMDSEGRAAKVEGTLRQRTYSEGQVKHLAKDGGEDPDAVSGTRTELELPASGVKF